MPKSSVYPDLERAPGKRDNWVEQAGGLPSYIERIAKHLHHEQGMSISRAIATAVSKVKKWAAGGDNVTAGTKAKAAKAVAEWEALKARNRAKSIVHAGILLETKKSREFSSSQREKLSKSGQAMPDGSYPIPDKGALRRAIQSFGRAKNKDAVKRHIIKRAKALGATDMLPEGWNDTKSLPNIDDLDFDTILGEDLFQPAETKDEDVGIEFKSVGVSGVDVIDEDKGIVSTIVSVTGLRDGVKDIIHADAFKESLDTRTPKGVWSHKWEIPVAKTLEVKELKAGDSNLPDKLPNGKAWPEDAGALAIKTQFNLDTQRGREAYSDVVFFADQQEWSIGYRVPPGGAKMDKKTGERHIYKMDLYEYSPVLFGAMPAARTQKVHEGKSEEYAETVHEAQVEYKSRTLTHNDFLEWKSALAEGADIPNWLEAKVKDEDDDDEDAEENYENAGEDEDLEPAPDADDDAEEQHGPDDEEETEEDEVDEEDEDDEEEKSYPLTGYERETLVQTFRQIGGILGYDVKAIEEEGRSEGNSTSTATTLKAAVEANESAFGEKYDDAVSLAEDFDSATAEENAEGAVEAADGLLTIMEDMDADDDDTAEAVADIADAIDRLAPADDEDEDEEDGDAEPAEKPRSGRTPKRDDVEDEKSFEGMVEVSKEEIDMLRKSVLDR